MLKNFSKIKKIQISRNFKSIDSSVFACYSITLIKEFLIDFLKRKNTKENILGTIRFNYKCINKYPEISTLAIEEIEYLSFRFIQIANRYLKKFLNLNDLDIFNILNKEQVYLNIRYLISIIELVIQSSPKKKFIFYSPTSGNRIVDKLFQKYYFKRNKIQVKISYLSKIIKPKKDLSFIYKKVTLDKSLLRYIFLRPLKCPHKSISNIGFIHHPEVALNNPYNKLMKDIGRTKKITSLNFMLIYQIGSKNLINFLFVITFYSIKIIRKNILQIIKHNLYGEIIQTISNQIFYECCINTIQNLNLKTIISTYISIAHENILYKACNEIGAVSIFYDFSMGYPGCPEKNISIGSTQIDTNRIPNYLITCGQQRCNQYRYKKIKNFKNQSIILNALCPQVEYARNQKNKLTELNIFENKKIYKSNNIKISIFDNVYGYNFYISEKDVHSCINNLEKSKLKITILSHNKRKGILDGYLKNSDLLYILQNKGDFTFSYFSDYIISIGYQSAALKSAYAFDKPLIFFTENKKFFVDANFFFDKNKNNSILEIVNKLTYSGESLRKSMSCKKEYENFLSNIKIHSKLLIEALGLNKNLISAKNLIDEIVTSREKIF